MIAMTHKGLPGNARALLGRMVSSRTRLFYAMHLGARLAILPSDLK
jgi:hypothetical protein